MVTGHPDIGGSRASMVNIVAELLGIDYRKVQALIGDTSSVGFSALTGGSRVTFAAGIVVTKATEQVILILRERAAKIWRSMPRQLSGRTAKPVRGLQRRRIPPLTLAALAAKASATGGPIIARSSLNTEGAEGGFATQICDVEVDPETGKVQVIRYTGSRTPAGRSTKLCGGQIQAALSKASAGP